jgi:hypothetical protein
MRSRVAVVLVLVLAGSIVLLAATAGPGHAVTKETLRSIYPTLEAAAHRFGAMDVNHTVDHRLLITATFPPGPDQFSGMIRHPEDFQDREAGAFTLEHVIVHNGRTLADLDGAHRPDITVWDDPVAKISRGRSRYRVGTVHPDLTVEVFPELRDAFPGEYVYVPAFDAVFEAPFALPRVAYTRVAHRRRLSRGRAARFALAAGGAATLAIDVVRHFGDERRFLVGRRGRRAMVLGEMFPFALPETDRDERHHYRHSTPLDRKVEFALVNELAGFEDRATPLSPADPTIVYGVRLFGRYLVNFDPVRGPLLSPDELGAPEASPAADASPGPAAASPRRARSPAAAAAPAPAPGTGPRPR